MFIGDLIQYIGKYDTFNNKYYHYLSDLYTIFPKKQYKGSIHLDKFLYETDIEKVEL